MALLGMCKPIFFKRQREKKGAKERIDINVAHFFKQKSLNARLTELEETTRLHVIFFVRKASETHSFISTCDKELGKQNEH